MGSGESLLRWAASPADAAGVAADVSLMLHVVAGAVRHDELWICFMTTPWLHGADEVAMGVEADMSCGTSALLARGVFVVLPDASLLPVPTSPTPSVRATLA